MNSLTQPNNTAVAVLQDQKATTVSGGTFTNGAWRTRDLNTEVSDPFNIVSVASNQFTLQAGRYLIEGETPVNGVDLHQCRLQNITDAATVAYGTCARSNSASSSSPMSTVAAVVTITAAKVFELQHRCQTTVATNGFGLACSFGNVEVYSQVTITRL